VRSVNIRSAPPANPARIVLPARHPAPVAEQIRDGRGTRVGNVANLARTEDALRRTAQVQAPFLDQLQNCNGQEHLGDAADAEQTGFVDWTKLADVGHTR